MKYHKIPTLFKRDPATNHRTLLDEYATPELGYLATSAWEFTEKIDGTNIRVMFEPADDDSAPDVTFGGKTERAQIPAKLVKHLQETFTMDLMSHAFDGPTCLYGEGCGAGIQKGGGNHYPDQRFVLFDVKIGDWWLKREDVNSIATALSIPSASVVGHGNLGDMVMMVRNGFDSQWPGVKPEGIVARPTVGLCDRAGRRIITKLKAKDFR